MLDFLKIFKTKMSEIYFILIFTALTFYMHNGFYDIHEAKQSMLYSVTFFYVVAMIPAEILQLVLTKKGKGVSIFWKPLNAIDVSLLAFAGISLLSTAFSADKRTSFHGSSGCRIGFIMILLLCSACILLSKNMQLNRRLLLVVIVSGYIVFLWGITNCFDLDFMHWYENMGSNPYNFISTIGNINNYTGYLSLLLPLIAILFLYDSDQKAGIFYAIYLFLGFINLYIAKSDGNVLIFSCAILLVYCALKSRERWKRFVRLIWIFVLASIVVVIICIFVNPIHVTGTSILGTLQTHHWYFMLAIVALCLQLAGEKIISLHLEKAWLLFCGVVIIALFVIAACNFDSSFGTNRGYIWTYTIKTFIRSDWPQKVIGWGPACFKNAVYSMAGDDIFATWPENNQIANAHNEILQYLITMGVVGMIAYLAVFAAAFLCVIQKRDTLAIACQAALIACFCTSLVYNPYPVNYGVLFVILAMVNMKCDFAEEMS